ncbi:hypothetical protein Btru_050673 [Bulinus truncatus]|nr:hypothetical protein Btru_050673 [Bulinus truncatus]
MEPAGLAENCYGISNSSDRRDCFLRTVQADLTFKYIPLFVYLCVVALTGMFGNSLILAVYHRRARKTATIIFIEAIAVTDLLTNVLVIPVTYYVLMTSVTVETYQCRVYYYLNYSTNTTSVVLLLALAVVRYRKICVPFGRQVTARHARFFSVAIAFFCSALCVPYTIVYGRAKVEFARSSNVTVYECSINEMNHDPTWPRFIGVFSIIFFLLCCVPLTVMYMRIGFEAQRRRRLNYSASKNFKYDKSEDGVVDVDLGKGSENQRACQISGVVRVENDATTSSLPRDNEDSVDLNATEKDLHRKWPIYFSSRSHRGKAALNRTTVMLLTISAIYILTNLTTLVLILFKAAVKLSISSLNATHFAVFTIFLYSFALNSAVNAIIFIALDRNFRLDSLKLIKSLSSS